MKTRICFLGDSFVNGTGDPTYLGWTGRVCQDLCQQGHQITMYNLGIRGETSQALAQRWYPEVQLRTAPHYDTRVVFSFGTNDTTGDNHRPQVDPQDTLRYTRQILSQAQQHYPVLLISPPPIDHLLQRGRIQDLIQNLEILCQELQIPYLDIFTPLLRSRIWMEEVAQGDGAHPQAGGYEEMAQWVKGWRGWQEWFPPMPM